jgi:MFS family permease
VEESISGHVLSKGELVATTSALDRVPGTGSEPNRALSRTPRTRSLRAGGRAIMLSQPGRLRRHARSLPRARAGTLFASRALEGIAVGATTNTLGAVLLDLRPPGGLAPLLSSNAPSAGMALGVLLTAVLAQYGPAPTQLVWWLLLGLFAAAFVLVAVMPETGTRRPGALASLGPHVSVPRPARGAFARAVPATVAAWALGGFYLSLGPSLAAQLTGSRNLLWGGAVTFLLTGVVAATAFAVRNAPAPVQMLGGCLALMAGAAVMIAAIETSTAAVLLLGTGVARLGVRHGVPGRLPHRGGPGRPH